MNYIKFYQSDLMASYKSHISEKKYLIKINYISNGYNSVWNYTTSKIHLLRYPKRYIIQLHNFLHKLFVFFTKKIFKLSYKFCNIAKGLNNFSKNMSKKYTLYKIIYCPINLLHFLDNFGEKYFEICFFTSKKNLNFCF